MKKLGTQATEDMMATYRIMLGMSDGVETHRGEMSWPKAAPKGLARDATAVAVVRPLELNQRLL